MRYCGRHFAAAEIELIRELIALSPPISPYQLSREVCARLNWRRADGKLKDMSCRVAMLRMQADDLFTLPPPRNAKPVAYRAHLASSPPCWRRPPHRAWTSPVCGSNSSPTIPTPCCGTPTSSVITTSAINSCRARGCATHSRRRDGRFARLRRERLENQTARLLHRLDQPTAPAQLAPPRQQRALLILPWIQCPDLAPRALALISRRLVEDWYARYAYCPVLLETFVEKPGFAGTCYKAANWQYLGDTQGRGSSTRSIAMPNRSKVFGFIHSCATSAAPSATNRPAVEFVWVFCKDVCNRQGAICLAQYPSHQSLALVAALGGSLLRSAYHRPGSA